MRNRLIGLFFSLLISGGVVVYNYSGEDVILPDGTEIETEDLKEHLTKEYKDRELKDIDSLTIWIHHTAVTADASIEAINNYHVNHNNWARIAYHSGVMPNGNIYILNPLDKISYHTKGQNTKGLSIVLFGNYNKDELTDDQLESIKLITDALCLTLPIKSIKGHRDSQYSNTSCPGDNAYDVLTNELFY